MSIIDIKGKVFSRLTVINLSGGSAENGSVLWTCVCECGKYTTASGTDLRKGRKGSCGCFLLKGETNKFHIHGMSNTKVFKTWSGIKRRCRDPRNKSYVDYGARGIDISQEYAEDFEKFYEEVGDPPTTKHTIDRIDNNKGYERGNMRWVLRDKQVRNRRKLCSNTSGETGVYISYPYSGDKSQAQFIAYWYEDGKVRKKIFSTSKYGLLPAHKNAIEYRRNKIEELNQQGAGYTENHGK